MSYDFTATTHVQTCAPCTGAVAYRGCSTLSTAAAAACVCSNVKIALHLSPSGDVTTSSSLCACCNQRNIHCQRPCSSSIIVLTPLPPPPPPPPSSGPASWRPLSVLTLWQSSLHHLPLPTRQRASTHCILCHLLAEAAEQATSCCWGSAGALLLRTQPQCTMYQG